MQSQFTAEKRRAKLGQLVEFEGCAGLDERAYRKVFSRTIFKGVSLGRTCIGTTMDRNTGV